MSSYLEGEYTARLVRTICADPNPEGMGLLEEAIDCSFAGSYAARVQPFTPGSCVKVPLTEDTQVPDTFSLSAIICPTQPGQVAQTVFSVGAASSGCTLFLGLDCAGRPRVAVKMSDDSWSE